MGKRFNKTLLSQMKFIHFIKMAEVKNFMNHLGLQNVFLRIKSVCYLLFKSFIISQFNYCPVVWMCFGGLNNNINKTFERALWIVYQHKKFSFEILLKRDKFVSIHIKKPLIFGTHISSRKKWPFSGNHERNFFFRENQSYNLRTGNHLAQRNIWTTQYQIENVSNLGATTLDLRPG